MVRPPFSHVQFFEEATAETSIASPIVYPETFAEAEFIRVAGLPARGQTHWVEKHAKEYPTKYFAIIGLNTVFSQMGAMNPIWPSNPVDRLKLWLSQALSVTNQLVMIAGKIQETFLGGSD